MNGEGGWMKQEELKRRAQKGVEARRKTEPDSWATRRALQDPRLRKQILGARRRADKEEP